MAQQWNPRYSRRDVLRAGTAAIASSSALLSPSSRSVASAQGTPAAGADFNWRRFEGEEIGVLLALSPRSDLLVEYETKWGLPA